MHESVIIVWATSKEAVDAGELNVLAYGNKEARIFERDQVDGRVLEEGKPPPYCATVHEMLEALTKAPRTGVQLDVREARNIGLL